MSTLFALTGWVIEWEGVEVGVMNTRSLLLLLLLLLFWFFKFTDFTLATVVAVVVASIIATLLLLLHRDQNVVCWQMTNNRHAPSNLFSIILLLYSLLIESIVKAASCTFRLLRDQYFQLFSQTLFHVQSSMKLVLFEFFFFHHHHSSC